MRVVLVSAALNEAGGCWRGRKLDEACRFVICAEGLKSMVRDFRLQSTSLEAGRLRVGHHQHACLRVPGDGWGRLVSAHVGWIKELVYLERWRTWVEYAPPFRAFNEFYRPEPNAALLLERTSTQRTVTVSSPQRVSCGRGLSNHLPKYDNTMDTSFLASYRKSSKLQVKRPAKSAVTKPAATTESLSRQNPPWPNPRSQQD